ncbi:MAG: hypothetical protein P8188_14495, partial [Gemmatimonadota bacterium]
PNPLIGGEPGSVFTCPFLQNQVDLARAVALPPSTAQPWMDLLEASYQPVRLDPGGDHLENLVGSELWAWRETRPRMIRAIPPPLDHSRILASLPFSSTSAAPSPSPV